MTGLMTQSGLDKNIIVLFSINFIGILVWFDLKRWLRYNFSLSVPLSDK